MNKLLSVNFILITSNILEDYKIRALRVNFMLTNYTASYSMSHVVKVAIDYKNKEQNVPRHRSARKP
jgi:hypothetical protein